MNPVVRSAFIAELEKLASPLSSARNLASRGVRWMTEYGPARGAMVGAGAGAVGGAATSDSDDRFRGAVTGALGGGLLGAGAGAFGRAVRDVKLMNPQMGTRQAAAQAARNVGTGIKNFGKRQIHSVTGAYRDQAGEIGIHGMDRARKRVNLEKLRLEDRLARNTGGAANADKLREESQRRIQGFLEEGERGQRLLDANATSLWGLTKGLIGKDRGRVARTLVKDSLGSPGAAAMTIGAPLAFNAPDILRGDESSEGGKSLGNKLMSTGAQIGASVLGAGVPLVGQSLLWTGAESAADLPFGRKAPTQ